MFSFPHTWIEPDWCVAKHVKAFTTVRDPNFGHSVGQYHHFNLGLNSGEDEEIILTNRQLLREKLQLPSEPYWLTQVHGNQVIVIEENLDSFLPKADAAVTFVAGLVPVVLTADCLPIFLADAAGTCVAAVHAGWRGLSSGIIEQTVQCLKRPGMELCAWLGPAISAQAFVVGEEVKHLLCHQPAAELAFNWDRDQRLWHADLYLLARQRLESLGVDKISGGHFCTYQEENRFYSYRRSEKTGRMASLIWIER